ncbi:TonB family protein [Mesorhizobium qingshengii]|uniref:Protein TonB n=1 Tax=Mesorhizobium qingshengii TaxID=1165689 RepID=A0A1G5W7X7_9HYPH|nr:energy transducer TonB [Mesorhizobium qingshengii]SDA54064.1 protein TonB [Mesorhizobium qingshengii]
MTPSAALPMVELSRFGWRDIGLWAGAALLVLGAHVAVAYAVQSFSLVDESDGGPPPAQVIEMAPMVAMPAVEEQIAALDAVTPDQTEPEAAPEKPVEQMPVVEQEAVPPDETEPVQTDVAEQADQPPLEEVVPDIVETVAPDVIIPLPQAKPVEAPKERKPVEAKAKKPVEKPRPRPRKEKAVPPKTATVASADARPAAKTAAPKSAETASRSGVNPARWNSSLAAWIRRHTRYPSAARARRVEGDVRVTFTIDSSGRVLSARMARSSGDPDLDRAALAVLQGATVPAPPAELGSRVSRTAPFVFSLRK